MIQSSNTDISPETLAPPLSIVLTPKQWIESNKEKLSFKGAFIIFFLAVISQQLSKMLLSPTGFSKPIFSLITDSFLLFAIKGAIVLSWAMFIDFSAQLNGYKGNIKKTYQVFLQLEIINLFILPWSLFFWGLDVSPISFYLLGSFIILVWLILLQILSIKEIYSIEDNKKIKVFIFPLILFSTFFFFISMTLTIKFIGLFI